MDAEGSERGLSRLWKRARAFAEGSWAVRSLAVGAVATGLDVLVLLACVKLLGLPTQVGAMVGVSIGSTLTFFANRHYAFRDHGSQMAPQALKFVLTTSVGAVAHAGCITVFTEKLGVPLVLAKMMSDVCVFTFAQLLLLRYVVFPEKKAAPSAEQAARLRRPQRARTRERGTAKGLAP